MATTEISTFQHEPLKSPERQIRLLSVLPSGKGSQARYELKTYILGGHRTPHFYAISYEWGQPQPSHDIIIDDKVFSIRSNLKDCLERFGSAYVGFYRPVWIDAICIDQSNLAERNAQVKIMGQIYSSATLVIAWFGKQAPARGSLTEAISCLQDWQLSEDYKTLLESSDEPPRRTTRTPGTSQPQLLSLADPYGPMWNCLRDLCEQTYWTRLWIVQELVKAKELLFMWGDEQVPWNILSVAFRTIQLNNLRIRSSETRFAPWDVISLSTPFQVWLQRDGAKKEQTLLELMKTYRHSDCSVAHDKAYALTGISTDAHLVQVDYDKSLPDLYVNLIELVTDKSQCAKYSHMILDSLGLDAHQLLSGTGMSSLRGHHVECDAEHVGRVDAAKAVGMSVPSINVETDIFELLLMASAMLTPTVIDRLSQWARSMHRALQEQFKEAYAEVTFFWLSSNRLGATLSTIPVGHSVYGLPGVSDPYQTMFIRVDDGEQSVEEGGSMRSGVDSPPLSSPTQSYSTLFSEPGTEMATRVWLSEVEMPHAPPPGIGPDGLRKMLIQIPLSDLVALDKFLDVNLQSMKDSVAELRRDSRQNRLEGPRRRSTRESVSISEVIDQAMASPSERLTKSSTWPTYTAGQAFVDALSRDLRDKLFASGESPLNSPD